MLMGEADLFGAFAWLFLGAMSEQPAFALLICFLAAIFLSACGMVLIPRMPRTVRLLLGPLEAVLCVLSIWILYVLHAQPKSGM